MHFTALILVFINNLVRSDYYSLDIFKYVLFSKYDILMLYSLFNLLMYLMLIYFLLFSFSKSYQRKQLKFTSIFSRARINK